MRNTLNTKGTKSEVCFSHQPVNLEFVLKTPVQSFLSFKLFGLMKTWIVKISLSVFTSYVTGNFFSEPKAKRSSYSAFLTKQAWRVKE